MTTQKQTSRSSSWALTLFAIGVFMAALDNGIISAALTTINASFNVDANWGHGVLHSILLDSPLAYRLSGNYLTASAAKSFLSLKLPCSDLARFSLHLVQTSPFI